MLKDFFRSKKNTIIQFLKFGIVGLSNTVLSYVLYLLFLKGFEHYDIFSDYDYLVSSIFTFCICTTWSFYWNNKFTFGRNNGEGYNAVKAFIKTVLSYSLTGLILHNILLYVLVEYMGIAKQVVPLINLVVTVPLNFLLNKYWAFRAEEEDGKS